MTIRYVDAVTPLGPEAVAFVGPSAEDKKRAKRKAQRYYEPTGRAVGRPALTEMQAAELKAKRLAYMRDKMRERRAKASLSLTAISRTNSRRSAARGESRERDLAWAAHDGMAAF